MLKLRTVTGLTDLYVLFYSNEIAVPAVEGVGNDATWYFVSDASLVAAGLTAGFHSGVFLQGDYTAPDITDDDTNGGVFTGFNWNGTTEVEDLGIGAAGAGLTALGDTRIANLDAAISTRLASASYSAPDNYTIGVINAWLQDDTYGLPPLLAAVNSRLAEVSYVAPDNTNIGNIYSIVNSGTYGNAALKALIEAITVSIATGTITSVIAQDKIVVTGIPGDFDHTYEGCTLLIYSNDEIHYAVCSVLTSLDSGGNVELTLEYEIPFELEGGETIKLLQPGFSKLDRDNLASILTEAFQQFFSANTGQKTIDDLTTPKTINISVDD